MRTEPFTTTIANTDKRYPTLLIRSGILNPGYLILSVVAVRSFNFLPKHQLTFSRSLKKSFEKNDNYHGSGIFSLFEPRCDCSLFVVKRNTTAEFCLVSHSRVTKVQPFALSRKSMSNAFVLGF